MAATREGVAKVDIAVDEVTDDLDLRGDGEGLASTVAQVARDAGDAVGLLDTELGDRQVRAVEANQGDVSSMKSGDKRQMGFRVWRASVAPAVR